MQRHSYKTGYVISLSIDGILEIQLRDCIEISAELLFRSIQRRASQTQRKSVTVKMPRFKPLSLSALCHCRKSINWR